MKDKIKVTMEIRRTNCLKPIIPLYKVKNLFRIKVKPQTLQFRDLEALNSDNTKALIS